MKSIGPILIILAFLLAIGETVYFGVNFLPKSIPELIMDITCIILLFVGIHLTKTRGN